MAFYPWLSPDKIESLDSGFLNDLHQAMVAIKAQDAFDQMAIVSYPKMKKEFAEKYRRSNHEKAFPWIYDKTRKKAPITAEQLQQRLSGKGK